MRGTVARAAEAPWGRGLTSRRAAAPAGHLSVWAPNARDLRAGGMTISTDAGSVRCYGSDTAGYEDQETACGSASLRLSKILTRQCGMVISVPILKDHNMSGLTFSMKNMYGVIDKPFRLHGNNCNPGVADLNALSVIRDKVNFTIGDALTSVYEGGPVFQPQYLWHPGTLIVGHDRVAVAAAGMFGGVACIAGIGADRSRPLERVWAASYHAVSYSLRKPNCIVILRLTRQSSWMYMPQYWSIGTGTGPEMICVLLSSAPSRKVAIPFPVFGSGLIGELAVVPVLK